MEDKTKKLAKAKLSYLRISPKKVRRVADVVRGLSASEAEAQLLMNPRRSSGHLLKLLNSAVANAKNNHAMDIDKLYIKEIKVDQAPTLKRWRTRAFGSMNAIRKKTSHISIILGEKEDIKPGRYIVYKDKKKDKKEKSEKNKDSKKDDKNKDDSDKMDKTDFKSEKEISKNKNRKGGLNNMFRRKSI